MMPSHARLLALVHPLPLNIKFKNNAFLSRLLVQLSISSRRKERIFHRRKRLRLYAFFFLSHFFPPISLSMRVCGSVCGYGSFGLVRMLSKDRTDVSLLLCLYSVSLLALGFLLVFRYGKVLSIINLPLCGKVMAGCRSWHA
jgi:hypothetical protein